MARYLLLLILGCTVAAHANHHYQCYFGEESYYLWRTREGGSKQRGRLDGIHTGIDRIKRYGWYIGADYQYATGLLNGRGSNDTKLHSHFTDKIVEGRAGYTLKKRGEKKPFFTPFLGWGYFHEVNNFLPPSQSIYKSTDVFNFAVVGFLSGTNITTLISVGINFKARFMQNAKSKITDDPDGDNVKLKMEDEILCRLDIPITFMPCSSFFKLGGQLMPFYEFRHFGGREGYPFNFRDTKFQIVGLRLALVREF